MFNRIIFIFVLLSSLGGVALLPREVLAQQPKPPTLCVEGEPDCGVVSSPSNQRKWNPGHYVKTQGQMCNPDQIAYFTGISNGLKAHVASNDSLIGALVIYAWGALETNKSAYDWTRVHEHLDWPKR